MARRTYEKNPQFPVLYTPPEGVGPAQAKYILTESLDQEAYVATLMYAAERGAIDLTKNGDAWVISDKQGAQGWAGLDEATLGVAHLLGGPGTSFVAAPKDVSAGLRLKTEIADFDSTVKSWASDSGHLVKAGLGGLGGLMVLSSLVLVGVISIWNPLNMTMLAIIPGAFAITGMPLSAPVPAPSGPRRDATCGRRPASSSGSSRRPRPRTASTSRAWEELYTAYIPWAVAFGVADQWAAKYRTEMGVEPPTPSCTPAPTAPWPCWWKPSARW